MRALQDQVMASTLLADYLAYTDPWFDPVESLLTEVCRGHGYHSRLPQGACVHPLRESLGYALALLQGGECGQVARANAVLSRVLALQDTDPFSPTYGIWSWYLEESLEQMDPPDWNWADFLGMLLAQAIRCHADRLDAMILERARAALGHAALCIFRRNVHLEYTNIAVMGSGATAAAGEMLHNPSLLDFGRERLRRIIALAELHGGFVEYSSPTYTMVVIEECERILLVCRDAQVLAAAEEVRRTAWRIIAEQFHPGTGQWSGPQSRAYSDRLSPQLVRYLTEQTGAPIRSRRDQEPEGAPACPIVPALPCPADLIPAFHGLAADVVRREQCLVRREHPAVKPLSKFSSDALRNLFPAKPARLQYGDRRGTTWMVPHATLGSVNHEDLWNQRRTLLAYWATPQDPAVAFRLRFLHDGRDFASAFVRNHQVDNRVLSAISLLSNRGDWHPLFDHPADEVFVATEFRLRYQLTGVGVSAERLDGSRFALSAGGYRIVVHASMAIFDGADVAWTCGDSKDEAWIDAVCTRGNLDLRHLGRIALAAGVELLNITQPPTPEPIEISVLENGYRAIWGDLHLTVPSILDAYPA